MKTNGNEPVGPVLTQSASLQNETSLGLTKREYFAALATTDVSVMDKEFAEALAGYKIPERKILNGQYTPESLLAIAKFWSDVEATYRVLKADALIAALNRESEDDNG
jgi:hypothetical protein